jgi:DNA primase
VTSIFPDETISAIADRTSIVELVSSYVSLKKTGKYYKGLCPFHPDKNPSFIVNEERNIFHCFGCGTGGDVYTFFMKMHNCSFPHAVRELAQRAGIRLTATSAENRDKKADEEREEAFRVNQFASELFHRFLLKGEAASVAREIFSKRGLTKGALQDYRLGFAPDRWDFLVAALTEHRLPLRTAEALGLIVPKKSGQGYYDRFRNRLMFPIFDSSGRVLAFGGRVVGEEEPKYLNSPESFLYNKRASLYGLSHAHQAIRSKGYALLVEGYFDVLTLHRFGFRHAVAALGTSVTPQQIDLLGRFTKKVVVVFDGDPAGRKAAVRSVETFFDKGLELLCIFLPGGHDPDSFLIQEGPEPFGRLLETARPALQAILEERLAEEESLTPARTMEILGEMLPLVSRIRNPLEKDLQVRSLADRLGVDESLLRRELSNYKGPGSHVSRRQENDGPAQRQMFPEERLVCQLLVQFPRLVPEFNELNERYHLLENITNEHVKTIIELIVREYQRSGTLHLPRILAELHTGPALELLSRCACSEEFSNEEAVRALDDSARKILLRGLREEARELNRKIKEAEKKRQLDLCLELSVKKRDLIQRERELMGPGRFSSVSNSKGV